MATYPDWFQVSQSGTTLNVTRKDRKAGWPFELKFQCSTGARAPLTEAMLTPLVFLSGSYGCWVVLCKH